MNTDNQNPNKSARAIEEEKILAFWQEQNIFEKSLNRTDNPKGEYTFYEGPPTANGKPGIHHLEARAFKDAIPRYKTMQGFYVRRKGGWDTHGLPVELQVEKELGLKSKKEVEGYGVSAFNKKCKESVWQYLDIWNKFTHRIGYWVDQEHPYVTYHNSYIESVWNVVGKVNARNLLYKDYKVVPWCPRCGTALSSHELAQGYQDVKDLSVIARFKITDVGFENTSILAWTTTPWTLPGNVALAVGADIKYSFVQSTNDIYIVASELVGKLFTPETVLVLKEVSGSDLIGLEYVPLYPYLKSEISNLESASKAFKVYGADFVTTTDGTGVVHTAVMYGQDDFELGTKIGLPKFHTVDVTGNFISGTDFLAGRFVKDEEVAIDIIKDLAHRGLLFKKEKYEHSYPHCWRCKTPLIYYARDSWYIRMSELKGELVNENKSINWEPTYIRDGRFGEWLKDIKDWAISRERYWGTPLPIWEKENGERVVIDSIATLKNYTKKSGNEYHLMRHGFTKSNGQKVWSCDPTSLDHVTEEGKIEIQSQARTLVGKGIDMIVCSPFVRTTETANLVADILGIEKSTIIIDARLGEWQVGQAYQGTPIDDFLNWRRSQKTSSYFVKTVDGESYQEVVTRAGECMYDLEKKYHNKNILIISHGSPLRAIELVSQGFSLDTQHAQISSYNNFLNAEIRKIDFVPIPHNEHCELDLHKPYIDEVELVDEAGNKMTRVKEVMDVWFDSGCMPFAQDHYPFDFAQGGPFEGAEVAYPADFICEAIDQTRGWFYTLHAVGTLLGRGKAYKNVICLGHILDAEGKKMSKSLGNIVDPWDMMEKYGVDPLRFWTYTVNQPGEPKNFDEKTVLEISRKVFTLLDNVVAFYELYRDGALETNDVPTSTNVLDVWILAKLSVLTKDMTENLDVYKLLEPGRALRDFIDDLSTWYLRRSRDRLKEANTDDSSDAKRTLYFVLKTVSKLMAPMAPFMAESLYQKLRMETDPESVHLESWPVFTPSPSQERVGVRLSESDVLEEMQQVRTLISLALQSRQKAGIAVRQPLVSVSLKSQSLSEAYIEIMKDELNVKGIVFNETQPEEVVLDTEITGELKAEGDMREFIRAVQDMRKKKGLQPSDVITLTIDTDEAGQNLLTRFGDEIKKVVGAKDIVFGKTNGEEVVIDELKFMVQL